MDFGSINWLAVVVCVIVSMVSGTIWYNPKTFFPIWWKGIGKSGEPGMQGNMGMTWTLTILSSLVQAVFMALLVNALGDVLGDGPTLVTGATTGLILWLGFVAPTYLVNKLFAGHGLQVWAIEIGNHLINFVLFGAILGAWR
ncbi:MAG: DUF1761 domain-containing protein [Ardenticatenaceae bacterium]|nr:DUF1761 domain-containing protein [Anaerolineales bacterium]MCB9010123.1 DUF1761 domain-containing protein [Ardenticatenaceae bacterium]